MDAPTGKRPPWRLENYELLPENDVSFLCDVCRRINFRFLLHEVPMLQMPEVPLGDLERVLKERCCAFCRLVRTTLENALGSDYATLPTEYEGKKVTMLLVSFFRSLEATKPRRLILWIRPDPWAGKPSRSLEMHLAQEPDDFLKHQGLGRTVDSAKFNNILALYWIRMCRMGYGLHRDEEMTRPRSRPPPGFRLIDVTRGCIVPVDDIRDYVTLSYVWPPPGRPILKLSTSNKNQLIERDGSLTDPQIGFATKIPQTIKDAMEICKRVCEGYLWVDALCITQDDDTDRDNQIRAMDYIYSNSALTLVSTCGDGGEASIPGAGSVSRNIAQRVEVVQGFRLANRPWDFDRSVKDSKWNTRGWTYQERILSKRTLFVTPQQLFFKCCHSPSYLSEDLDSPPEARKTVTYPMDDTGRDTIPHEGSINVLTYIKIVEEFTRRNITYPEDILNAFAGVAENMKPLFRSDFLCGLPQSELDYCLAWDPAGAIVRRVCSSGVQFPSWSWAGWTGPVQYTFSERLSRVKWVHDKTGKKLTPENYRLPDAVEDGKGWAEKRSHSGFRYFYHSSDENTWFRNPTAPVRRLQGPNLVPGTQCLRFETETIEITMSPLWDPKCTDNATEPMWQFPLTDDGYAVGIFFVPTNVVRGLKPNAPYKFVRLARIGHGYTASKLRAKKGDSSVSDSGETKIDHQIALEDLDGDPDIVRVKPPLGILYPGEPTADEAEAYLPFDRRRYDAYRPFCLCEFLVVETVGGVSYRIGAGRMHVDAWAQEPPKTEVVTLG